LAAGKRPKVAIVACMRKLLGAIYSVARNRRPFVPYLRGQIPPMPAPLGGSITLFNGTLQKMWRCFGSHYGDELRIEPATE
jgi:hypothetical protein